jgi:tRNA isopentenyl-2-thiomethyl-A-37 hydroxylase MiaE
MAFLPRVSDAFQKLILKQKFKGYGGSGGGEAEPRSGAESSPAAESRSALKAAASRMGAVAPPPTRVDSYRPSGVPGGAARLADAVSAEPPQRAPAAPTASPEPTTSDPEEPPASTGPQRPRRRKKRIDTQPRPPQEGPLGILGVPRSAPPPPIPNAVDDAEERVDKTTRPDGQAATASMRLRKDTRPDRFPAFAAVHDSAPDAGDEPELSFEPVDETDPDLADLDDVEDATSRGNGRPVAPQGGGSYSMRDASTEVLGSRGGTRRREGQSDRPKSAGDTDRPPAARRRSTNRPPRLGDRTDPRREADGGAVVHEVVRLPRGAAAISAPSEQPAGETPEPVLARHSTPESDPAPGEPTVIVDMGDTVEALVDDLVQCGPDDEGAAVESLTHAGEAALPALVQRFPGPLWFDRYQPHKRLPRGRDVSAVARAMVRFGDRSVPYVASLVGSRDADIRFYATLLASEIVHRDLLFPLAQRIFDEDAGTRTLVLDVLRLFSKWDRDFEEMLKAVRVEARVDRADPDRRLAAIRALGELRDARSVELLAALLDLGDPEITEGAHGALVTIARQDFGDSARKWIGWLERNQDRHRIEWLIDALLHPDEDIRTAAGEELKSSTQEYHGYHPASPRRDREIAQRKYRTWWDSQGQRRFAR